ncbi:protease HtpX [Bdellovibrio bacteriovorus]|uniref:Protease HtpX homolog n=2 Tax=Bdellovibrio bacteriovorus TaxID=959 RepID=Q6MNG9_BDEBA|nr:protease HtpX [Bdellovibrio bacteriovorus]AHZ86498.1 protease HtpX [Bdellovibrio bacteriovorus]ASD64299.1 zinc metalloprotease HtpX [Bdellovibrio bacteriovorus]BEV67741.1 Protease HtpX [Bdellovibrio bacteriovorus]CAE79183.1 heat shock protein HtpX [Bdellovibrio bacteriovorus HD100]
MAFLKRIGLFVLTNVLVIVTIGIVWSIVSRFLGMAGLNSYIPFLMAFCAVWGMGGAFISLFMSKWMAKMFHGVKIIDANNPNPELRNLVNKVHEFARRAQLPKMPEVGIYESVDINAFATGPSKKNSLVAVSTGLLQRMNEKEVDGVLAHEVAHIANGDMVTMTLIQGIVNAFAMFFSRILAGLVAANVDEKYREIVRFAVTILGDIAFTMLGSIVVNYFSRQREFRADAGGAKYSSRDSMVAALQKLRSVYDLPIPPEEGQTATLMISNRDKGGIAKLFMTHPPLEVRIEALQRGRF